MTINPSFNPFVSKAKSTTKAIVPPCPSTILFPYIWRISPSINCHFFSPFLCYRNSWERLCLCLICWKWRCSPYSLDTSIVVRIASGKRLFAASEMPWGFRHMAPALGMGLSSNVRFGFGHVFRLRAFVWTFGKALRMQEWAIVLGSCSFWKSQEKSVSTVRSAGKSLKPGGGKVFAFL